MWRIWLLRTRRGSNSYLSFIRNWQHVAAGLQARQLVDVENRDDERLTRYPDLGFDLLPTPFPWGPLTLARSVSAPTSGSIEPNPSVATSMNETLYSAAAVGRDVCPSPLAGHYPVLGIAGDHVRPVRARDGSAERGHDGSRDSEGHNSSEFTADRRKPVQAPRGPSITYHWIPHFSENASASRSISSMMSFRAMTSCSVSPIVSTPGRQAPAGLRDARICPATH